MQVDRAVDLDMAALQLLLEIGLEAVLRALSWNGGSRPLPGGELYTTLLDDPRPGPLRPVLLDRLAKLEAR